MSGIEIHVSNQNVLEALRRLADRTEHISPAMRAIGEALVSSTQARMAQEVSPDGSRFKPLRPTTLARKAESLDHPSMKILRASGLLADTLAWQLVGDGSSVIVGSNRIYAGAMQFGASKGQYGRTQKGVPIPWGNVQARPFLGISTQDEQDIADIVSDWIDG